MANTEGSFTRRATRRRVGSAAGLLAALALATAACSNSSGPLAAGSNGSGARDATAIHHVSLASSSATPSATAGANSADVTVTVHVAPAPTASGATAPASNTTGNPFASLGSGLVQGIFKMLGGSVTITATGPVQFSPPAADITVSVAGKSIPAMGSAAPAGSVAEVRFVGSTLYATFPDVAFLSGGKPWLSYTLPAKVSSMLSGSGFAAAVAAINGADPSSLLKMLGQVSGSVTVVGHSDLNGVAVTEYQATIEASKVIAAAEAKAGALGLPAAKVARAEALLAKIVPAGATLPVEVWLDGQGHLRQAAASVSLLGISASVTVDLDHFGTPVNVVVPPASQVGTLNLSALGNLFGFGAHGGFGAHSGLGLRVKGAGSRPAPLPAAA